MTLDHRIRLRPAEVEQLTVIATHGMTDPGDLIDKDAERSLRSKGLVARIEGWCVATEGGETWLRRAGVAAWEGRG